MIESMLGIEIGSPKAGITSNNVALTEVIFISFVEDYLDSCPLLVYLMVISSLCLNIGSNVS